MKLGLIQTNRVLRICKDSGKILQEHDSIKDAMSFLGKTGGSRIVACCTGESVAAYGFRWSYPGESEKYVHLVKPVQNVLRMGMQTGEVLQEHASITDAKSFIGGNWSGITDCCMGRQISAHGYKWSYVGEESKHEYAKKGKAVLRIGKETDEVLERYESQLDAAKFVHLTSSSISSCCLGKMSTCGGYRWRFA